MHKKGLKFASVVKLAMVTYVYHSTKIAKARPHSIEWQTDSSVQKQWFMSYTMPFNISLLFRPFASEVLG